MQSEYSWVPADWVYHKIRELIKDDEFINLVKDLELHTWTSFVDTVKNFYGNRRAKSYRKLVKKMLKSLQDIGANISIKVHFLQSHLNKFQDNCSDVSDEPGGRFHQDIKTIEEH